MGGAYRAVRLTGMVQAPGLIGEDKSSIPSRSNAGSPRAVPAAHITSLLSVPMRRTPT